MNRLLKTAFYAAAVTGAAFAGWRFMKAGTPQPPGVREPSPRGDSPQPKAADDLTDEQRQDLLDELESQLGA